MTDKILIVTRPGDTHAHAIKYAMQKDGLSAHIARAEDLPAAQQWSLSADGNSLLIQVDDHELMIDNTWTIWNRRRGGKTSLGQHPEDLHAADRSFALSEAQQFFDQSLTSILHTNFSINPEPGRLNASSKPLQLKLAHAVGLNVPPTIFSNNATSIRSFTNKYPLGSVYKPFRVHQWDGETNSYLAHAAQITAPIAVSDKLLRSAPGIYQALLKPKAYEVRATFFGNYCVAVKLSRIPNDRLDWRSIPPEQLGLQRIELPSLIENACREVMKSLGIHFGCFDFVVDQHNKWWFLEVNEAGQFLWVEKACNDCPMLDIFICFATSGSPTFTYSESSTIRHRYNQQLLESEFIKQLDQMNAERKMLPASSSIHKEILQQATP